MKTAELREDKTNNFKIETKNKPFYQFSSKLKRVLRFRLNSCVSYPFKPSGQNFNSH